MGDYAKAEMYYLETKDITKQISGKAHPDYATLLNNLGNLYSVMGDYIKAEPYLLEAKSITEQILGKDHSDYVRLLNNLGNLYSQMGDYAKAETYYLEAKDIQERILGKDHPDYARLLNNLGNLYYEIGDYVKAEAYYLEAKNIRAQILGKDHPDYAASLHNFGNLYSEMGDYAKAETYYLEAKDIQERILGENHPDYARSLHNLGNLYLEMGNYTKAETYLTEANNITERILGKDHSDYAASLHNLGNLYSEMGDYTKAKTYYLEAKDIQERILGKNHPYYATSLNNIGNLYFEMGDYTKAEMYYLEAKNIHERILGKEHTNYAGSLNNLGRLYSGMGDYVKAENFTRIASDTNVNLVIRQFSFMSERQRDQYWNTQKLGFEFGYSLSWFHPGDSGNIINYNNTLFAKGLLLRTGNAIRDAVYSSNDATLISRYEELRSIRNQIGVLQSQTDYNKAYLQTLETRAEELDKEITKTSAAYREAKDDMAMQWRDVQAKLHDGEAAVEFVHFRLYDRKWTDKTIYAALVLKKGMTAPVWVSLCEEKDIQQLMDATADATASAVDAMRPFLQAETLYTDYGDKLYRFIWKPLEKELAGIKKVYYSPSGLLHKIAHAAIPVTENDLNALLADKYDLHLVSSTREVVYRDKRTDNVALRDSAVVYGGLKYDAAPDIMKAAARGYKPKTGESTTLMTAMLPSGAARGGNWNYLPGSRSEAEKIDKYLEANKITHTTYFDERGNEESFKNLGGAGIGLLHLATHGFFLEDIQDKPQERDLIRRLGGGATKAAENQLLRSGLILAGGRHAWANEPVDGVEDGILTADEISRVNLRSAKMVVLSACQTGLGDAKNSEGVFGLQRAFKLAGVETLIMSLWEVSDTATEKLMDVFYRQWLSGKMSRHDAFKEAQRQVRNDPDHSDWASPYYWASFVMMD